MSSPAEAEPARGPLLTVRVHERMLVARRRGERAFACSLDLDRSQTQAELGADEWRWRGRSYPYLDRCKERTIYHWTGRAFEPVARFGTSLLKLVPTDWGPPTFEIDGVKMLPTRQVSPYEDARRKVALIEPAGKRVLDTCAGLGYFAAWCLEGGASEVASYEIKPGRPLVAQHQSVVAVEWIRSERDCRRHQCGNPWPGRRFVWCHPARSTALRPGRRPVFAGLLRRACARAAARRPAVSLHRHAQPSHQRARRSARSRATVATRRVHDAASKAMVCWRCAGHDAGIFEQAHGDRGPFRQASCTRLWGGGRPT